MANKLREVRLESQWTKTDQYTWTRSAVSHQCPPHIWAEHTEYLEANWITSVVDHYYYCVICNKQRKTKPKEGLWRHETKTVVSSREGDVETRTELILAYELPLDMKTFMRSSKLRRRNGKRLTIAWKETSPGHFTMINSSALCPPHVWFETALSWSKELKPHYKCTFCSEEKDKKPEDGFYDCEVKETRERLKIAS